MKDKELVLNGTGIRSIGPTTIEWSWAAGEAVPRIDVKQRLLLPAFPSNYYWTIRYPEVAPPGARYELVVDKTPPITLEQKGQLKRKKMYLESRWEKEKEILDALLKLWPSKQIGEACAHERSRSITYKYEIYANCGLSVEVSIFLTSDTRAGVAARAVVSLDTGNPYRLTSIELPIKVGVVDPAPLKEYLNNNPLEVIGKALKAYSDTSLSGDYTYNRWTNP
jgi:hypothetical protein